MTARPARLSSRIALSSFVLVLLILGSGAALASGPDGHVRGFVTDYGSGVPIAGASVRLDASGLPWRFETTTDAAGYFDVAVPPRRYSMEVTHLAYYLGAAAPWVGSGEIVWANVSLVPAPPRSARLQGYVTDALSSAPVTTGQVLATMSSSWRNASTLNASGHYAMDLLPGSYDVQTNGTVGYDPYDYYPVTLVAGNPLWYNFTVNPNGGNAWINGTIRDAVSYATIAGARVTGRVGTQYLATVLSDAAGVYSLRSPPGNLEISADAAGHAPVSTTMYVSGAGAYTQDLYLAPLSSTVRGYVFDGVTQRGMAGIVVTVDPIFFSGYSDRTTTDASGYFTFALPNDDYVLRATAAGYTPGATYLLFWSSQTVWANLTLWPMISRVSGYLVDGVTGGPVPGLSMIAIDSRSGYSSTGPADASGFFTFVLPPSPAITVAAYGAGVYEGNIVYLETRPYATTWVNITIAHLNAQVLANVTSITTGLPISGASVSVSWVYGSGFATTNATGKAVIDAPAGFTVYLFAFASGYLTWSGTASLVPGPNPLSIQMLPDLPADVRVQGYIKDAGTGSGLWPASVEVSGYGPTSTSYAGGTGYYSVSIVAAPQTIRATSSGYAAAQVSVSPSPGASLWANFSLVPDAAAPIIQSFTATPPDRVSETNPTTLWGIVNETSLERADVSILMLYSTSGGTGTFLNLGRLDPAGVTMTQPTPGSYDVSATWNTDTRVGHFTAGATSAWWPTNFLSTPFQAFVNGYWDNATLASPVPGAAVFDTRTGALLYVITLSGFVGPLDQPASTFQPLASGLRVDLATSTYVGASLVTGPTFSLGSLRLSVSPVVPAGQYGALLETWDSASNYAFAVTLMRTGPDTVPPVANAGPDQTVNEDATVTFDGSASTDNVAIAGYTWTFVDGTPQTLTGARPTYVFATPGTYVVTLTVRDADGNTASDTVAITVRDTTNPIVSVTAPSEGATVSGPVLVSADATDNVAVVRVEFRVDNASVGNDTTAPFEFTVQSGGLSLGNHTITILAFDAAGNSASAVRHVRVTSAPPGGGPLGSVPVAVLFLGLAVVLVAAAGVALILLRRRRPRPPEANPGAYMAPPPPPPG